MTALPPIEVRRYGTGAPRVMLLHGGPGGIGYMAPVARELADEFASLEPLQRASGTVPMTVAQHVDDLHHVVGEIEAPLQLVGSSWGAILGLSYAARYPERVAQIVAIGCGTFDRPSRALFHRLMDERMTPAVRTERDALKREMGRATGRAARAAVFDKIVRIDTRLQSYDPLTDDLEIVHFDVDGQRETWADVVRLQDDGVQPQEFTAVTAPVVMLHGDYDPHVGSVIHKSLEPFVKQLQYTEIERCGHLPWLERLSRNEFFSLLREHLRSGGSG